MISRRSFFGRILLGIGAIALAQRIAIAEIPSPKGEWIIEPIYAVQAMHLPLGKQVIWKTTPCTLGDPEFRIL